MFLTTLSELERGALAISTFERILAVLRPELHEKHNTLSDCTNIVADK
jgi:hypothetical protein